MGWGIYIKSGINKSGKTSLFYRVTSGRDKVLKGGLNILIKPSDWDKRTLQVSAKVDNSIFINEKIDEISTRLKRGWNFFESGSYTWNEMSSYIAGDKTEMDLWGFVESTLKPKVSKAGWSTYRGSYGAVLKALGKDRLDFKDLSEDLIDQVFKVWKKNLRSASIKTYLFHFGAIINEAYKKKLTPYKYEKQTKWRKTKEQLNTIGKPYVETAKWEDFEKAIDRCTNLMEIEALGFWLMMFGMRGLYPSDLCDIHNFKWTIDLKEKSSTLNFSRHKTGEIMWIKYAHPFNDLQRKLRGFLELTHGYKTNEKTGKQFLNTKEYQLSTKEEDGWFFKDYNKDTWSTLSSQCRKIGMPPFKAARKTFETYALKLEVSADIRYKLLGHATEGIKQNYQDWEWEELQNQIHEAHELVLAHYHIDTLYPAYIKKANEILEKMGVSSKNFESKWNNYTIRTNY
tara:strand:+ start:23 stop:1390 length:1368 start_codon:yes stop_codon:yes gene_type:complete